ncbi:NYN domain-containing protein [Sphaerisporangium viridialbum]|uniref:NYN domain-containing protein n=1 Tax=Sphaerisporangium viridialbum TaxID=46189 RepID=UPI003C70D837
MFKGYRMLSLAWQDAYDVAVLLTSDADFIPAVERIQERGLKVINTGWSGKDHQLKAACWGSTGSVNPGGTRCGSSQHDHSCHLPYTQP